MGRKKKVSRTRSNSSDDNCEENDDKDVKVSSLEKEIKQLTLGMLQMQQSVQKLIELQVNSNSSVSNTELPIHQQSNAHNTEVNVANDCQYLFNWKKLGGNNLFFNPGVLYTQLNL